MSSLLFQLLICKMFSASHSTKQNLIRIIMITMQLNYYPQGGGGSSSPSRIVCEWFRVTLALRRPTVRESGFHETSLLLICPLVVETLSNENWKQKTERKILVESHSLHPVQLISIS